MTRIVWCQLWFSSLSWTAHHRLPWHTPLGSSMHILLQVYRLNETQSIGLQHPSSNHCHKWLRHRPPKTVSQLRVFCWCSNGSKSVADISVSGISLITTQMLMPEQINQNCLNWCESNFFSPVEALDVNKCALMLCSLHSLSMQTFHNFYRGCWQHDLSRWMHGDK